MGSEAVGSRKIPSAWQKLRGWLGGTLAAPPSALGHYALGERIAEGGMGVVYRATHTLLERPAAIKMLAETRRTPRNEARFEHEVKVTRRLHHPNTISVFEDGRAPDGALYYAMEYLDGPDLERLVDQRGPLTPARVIHVLSQVCGALAEAHALSLIHRDIKPANIVLVSRGDTPDVVKLVDFGLARALDGDAEDLTEGTISGTPLYLAPEAITEPAAMDARSDIYSLGAVAYFLLTAQHVFQGTSVVEVLGAHLFEAPVPPSVRAGKALPAELEALVLRCLAKDPAARPASAEALLDELRALEAAPRYERAAA